MTLCQATEKVFFHCTVKKTGKQVSLCGSKDLSTRSGYLQYRFGKPGKIELAFPSSLEGSPKGFRYAHYLRAQVSRFSVHFNIGKINYAVVDNHEGDSSPPVNQTGVVVTLADNTERELSCAEPYTGDFQALKDIVPCDPDDALNMGSCPH